MLGIRKNSAVLRIWCIRWLYLVVLGHFLVGLLMTWCGDSILFEAYNSSVLKKFLLIDSQAAELLQVWWIAIFGATLQAFSILLMGLIYLGNHGKNHRVWLLIVAAIIIWAPQDIYFSWVHEIRMNLWVDIIAVMVLLPPLLFLISSDRNMS